MQDKRRHPRVAIRVPISCEVAGAAPFAAVAADLSVGGLFAESELVPAFGTELTIVGDFPGAPGLRLPAIVRWARGGGFGVQFGLLGARETHLLAKLMHPPSR